MIGIIVRNAVNRPVAVIMLTFLALVFGIVSAVSLPVDFYPPIRAPKLTVATSYAGLPAGEVLELVTMPIEDALSTLQGIRHISSTSLDGISLVECSFSWGTDMGQAGIQARELSDIASLALPERASKPLILPVNPTERPMLALGVFPRDGMDQPALKRLCEREVRTAVQQAVGVGSVQVLGGLDGEILVEPDPARLGALGMTVRQIADAVEAAAMEVPAGSIERGTLEYVVKTESSLRDIGDLRDIRVDSRSGEGPGILLGDIASVTRSADDRSSFVASGGREGLALLVRGQSGFSPVTLSANVRGKVAELESAYGTSLDIRVLQDNSLLISESISALVLSGLFGIAIAFAVIILYLGDLGSSLILISSIPLSLVAAIACFPLFRIGINTMSLGGLSIGIGMLVDNSVVVLENVQRRADPGDRKAVVHATVEIADSTVGSTLTSVVVFMPLFFLPGMVGAVFRDLAWAVILSLASSFVMSITIVPVLFCRFGSPERKYIRNGSAYRKVLRFALRNPAMLAAASAAVLALGTACFLRLDKDLLKLPKSRVYTVELCFPPGSSLDYLEGVSRALSRGLAHSGSIGSSWYYAGGELDDPYYLASRSPDGETLYCCVETKGNPSPGPRELEELFGSFFPEGSIVGIEAVPSTLSFNEALGVATHKTVTFAVHGESQESARLTAADVLRGAGDPSIRLYPKATRAQILVTPDSASLVRMGIDAAALADLMGDSVLGLYPASLDTAAGRVPIRVRLPEIARSSLDGLGSLAIPGADGAIAPLSAAAGFSEEVMPPACYRRDRRHVVYLDVPKGRKDIARKLSTRFEDTSLAVWKEQAPAIALIFFLSVVSMYILLGVQFSSFSLPVILMGIIPFGFAGVSMALQARGGVLDLNAVLGSLVVIGVVVNNGILLYDSFDGTVHSPGLAAICVYRGSSDRVRAISISFFTTVLALVPIAADIGGKNSQSTMATAIIGGLTLANFLSIFAFPVIFKFRFSNGAKGRRNVS